MRNLGVWYTWQILRNKNLHLAVNASTTEATTATKLITTVRRTYLYPFTHSESVEACRNQGG